MPKSLVIPNDLAACQSLLAEQAQRLEEQAQRLEAVQRENAEQKLTISELLRRAFEKRSERYLENPDQLRLDFGDTAESASAAEGLAEALEQVASASAEIVVPEHTRRPRAPRKPRCEQLPAHLPRYEVTRPVLADCYAGYQGITLRSDSRIARAACNAHARRKLFDARENHPLLASQMLSLYQQLYDVEDRARGLTPAERQTLRESDSQPLWNRLREVLDGDAAKRVLPKEKIGEALGYLRNHGDALRLYLTDGRVPIDNNDVEQLMKQVAIGRKNWLFLGSVPAGERAANFLTLVSSAPRNDLDVYAYLKSVLDALLHGSTDYAALRPDQWATTHPETLRVYRREERQDRYARKSARRTQRRTKTIGNS